MALFGQIETVHTQSPASAAFATAWTYIRELGVDGSPVRTRVLGLAAGASAKHELDHGVVAIEQAYDTRLRSAGFFESHRKYIDIQVIVSGEERIEVIDLAESSAEKPYDDARDLIVHRDHPGASVLQLRAGQAAVFFPADVHMPCLRIGEAAGFVRKSVLKVPTT